MDPLFDRLFRLFQSWTLGDTPPGRQETGHYGDPYLRQAEEELDDFLNGSKRESADKWAEFEKAHQTESGNQFSSELTLVRAFQILDLPFLAPWEEVNAAHKKLILMHHPDRHKNDPESQAAATMLTQKINEAYQMIKKHYGK